MSDPASLLAQIQLSEARGLSAYAQEMTQFGPLTVYVGTPHLPTHLALMDGAQPPSLTDLTDTLAFFRERRVRPRIRSLNNLRPETLLLLSRAGFRLDNVLNLYTHDLQQLPAGAVGSVQPSDDPQRWAEVATQAFGSDNAEMMQANARRVSLQRWWYLAGGAPVGVAAMSLSGGVAALMCAATLPGQRGQGIHRQLLAARLAQAQAQQAHFATACAAPESISERNLRRAGFVLSGMRFDFAAQG